MMSNRFHRGRLAEAGFTLIEMLVVVAIIAILSGSVVLGYTSFSRTSNLRSDKILLAAYLRTAQRQAMVYRKDVVVQIVEASSQGATNESVEGRFKGSGATNALQWSNGTAVPGLGTFTPASTVDLHVDPVAYGTTEYQVITYTQTGTGFTIHMCDNQDSDDYGATAGKTTFSTFTSIATTGRVEVFPCGRNNPWASDWC